MKAVILAGGMGTRLSEETDRIPKPMVTIGGKPILWHIMKLYGSFGINDFVICLGYKAHVVKEYFHNYFLHGCDVTFDLQAGSMQVHSNQSEPWRVTLIDTGLETMTGGRLKRVRSHLDGTFCMTYGDGLADVDIAASIAFHRSHGKLATVTAGNPPGRFGVLRLGAPGRALLACASGEGDEVLKEHLLVRRVALQLEDSAAARCPADKVRGLTPGGEESPLQLRHLARKDGGLCSRRSLSERTFDLKCHAPGVHAIRTLDQRVGARSELNRAALFETRQRPVACLVQAGARAAREKEPRQVRSKRTALM
jgi:glucose-1-phosphate cytidylyltransferase